MVVAENKNLVHGLSNFHVAVLTQDSKTGVTYAEVDPIEGAVKVSVTPTSEQFKKSADNGIYKIKNSLGDIDGSMSVVDLPKAIKQKIYKQKESTNGVTFSNKDDDSAEIAVGFEAELDGGHKRFYWLLKGKPELMPIELETTDGTIESKDAEVAIKFQPLTHNGNWKAELDSNEVTSDQWFAKVIYDEETAEAITSTEPTE